ncbi:MAG: type II secretion system F family protein [Candidatus Micrarchaeaceae archaeon]
MREIPFERLVSRNVVVLLSRELDLAGVKMTINRLLAIMIVGGILLMTISSYVAFLAFKLHFALSVALGIVALVVFEASIYFVLSMKIDQRKTFVESILPDYLQLVAANVRSGIALDRAMVLAARPEFKYFSEDVKLTAKGLYAGETLQNALVHLAEKYRSNTLKHTVRMMNEAVQYGGGMSDLLNQVAKDIRNQQTIQKEISGQLFMYTIFIAFAALIGAPVMYGLTSQMIGVTNQVWRGILAQNPGGLPTTGVSFLRPSPPKITTTQYQDFAMGAIFIITAFGALIVSAVASGSVTRGIRYLPIFLLVGFAVFFITGAAIHGIFSTISGAGGAPAAP